MMAAARKRTGVNKEETGEGVLYLRNMPSGLLHQFKILCLQRQSTLHDEVIKLIRKEVEQFNDGKP